MKRTQIVSDKAQLTLRLTEDQILAQRAADLEKAKTAKGERFFNDAIRKTWEGTTRKINPMPKGKGHWLYHAQVARDIAASKTERKHRKYWNKIAAQHEMKARTAHSMSKFKNAYKELSR